ncbi:MAG: adenosine deaminase [Cellulomonas sp. 73-145]|uniref:adenosine deaminase n=1 Tax=Cellulomonas sp. 73-145 TaxID=1895739 RepID=UPI00092AAF0E|nr:adenosine deaminase [Cellulomonas sp. 73-145]MBN9326587.1 adenosine deaminase [Cellulomonas sp.]OJV59130.1 MAG: adenosine deaminase [Cellulomonas sp. 73-145]
MDRIAALPKVELHLHIEGTLEPELIADLAARHGIEVPFGSLAELRSRYEFEDLQSFLDLYYANLVVLRTADDFAELASAYLRRAAAGGVRHAEIFFDPQAHLTRGVPLRDVVDGLVEGCRAGAVETGTTSALIACFLRDRSAVEALEVLEQLVAMRAPIIGIGLDSAEVGNPPSRFAALYARAAELGLHRVAHAGEEGGPEYVREALDLLGVERVDHGIRSVEDADLLHRLAAERVPLTVCPLSNVRLHAVPALSQHPLPRLMAAGVLATISSDDPAYFGGYAEDNYAAVAAQLGLTDDDLAGLARNAVQASFLPPERKRALEDEVDGWLAAR